MSNNFLIASLIGRINLAKKHKKSYIIEKKSIVGETILKMLLNKHFIKYYLITANNFIIFLQYRGNFSLLREIKLISKPGKRIFVSTYQLESLLNKSTGSSSFYIISTVKGLLYAEDSIALNIAGELLIKIVI